MDLACKIIIITITIWTLKNNYHLSCPKIVEQNIYYIVSTD